MEHRTRGDVISHQSDSEESDSESSDEDYSPGSLVIDTKEASQSRSVSPSPGAVKPQQFFQTDFREESPEIPPIIIPTLSPPTPTPRHPITPSQHSQASSSHSEFSAPTTSNTPMMMKTEDTSYHGVSFVTKKVVTRNVDRPPLDTLCFYHFHWGGAKVDVITRNEEATLIPVKNIYEKVIPGLKRNVLSARNSKLGVKSIVLAEPYVSTLKTTDLGVSGSSHYMTIPNFTKICKYFKHPPPEILMKFDFVSSKLEPEVVLPLFNNPEASEKTVDLGGVNFGVQSLLGGPNLGSTPPVQKGRLRRKPASQSDISESESISKRPKRSVPKHSPYRTYNSPARGEGMYVDARRLSLPGGLQIILLIKGGEAYIPNPELAKILPVVSRTAMDQIRTQCGVTVTLANKAEIVMLKYTDVIRDKAGRVLLYKMSDVIKIYAHWHQPLPGFVREVSDGKFPEERLDPQAPYSPPVPNSSLLPDWTSTSSPQGGMADHMITSTPPTFNPNTVGQRTPSQPHGYGFSRAEGPSAAVAATGISSSLPSNFSPMIEQGSLTPERFQQPVNMLNSFQHGYMGFPSGHIITSSHGHVIQPTGHVIQSAGHVSSIASASPPQPNSAPPTAQNFMSPMGTKLDVVGSRGGGSASSNKRKRSLSISGPPLNDQEVEYTQLAWGDQTLTMLRPSGDQPYLAVPELVAKVFHHRSFVSVQRRAQLGVVSVPATSIQIHALRARGSLDTFTGNTKLISLSGAVKLAVDATLQIPGSVIQELKKHCKEPLESILHPAVFPVTGASSSEATPPTSSTHPSHLSHLSQPSHPPPSTSSTLTHFQIKPKRSRKSKTKHVASEEERISESDIPNVPNHPDVTDLGPKYRAVDGMMCQVRWNADKLVVYLTARGVNYMGLYQCYNLLFKQYVNRMSFKMRMRKLDIRSNRAPPEIRVKLIALNALPFNCPVCGLITVAEMEQLAKSYGITPPQVFYDCLITEPSEQTMMVKTKRKEKVGDKIDGSSSKPRSCVHQPPLGDGKQAAFEQQIRLAQDKHVVPFLGQPSGGHVTTQDASGMIVMSSGAQITSSSNWEEFQSKAGMERDSDSLVVSIPRQYSPYKVSPENQSYKTALSMSATSSPGQPPMKQLQSQFKTSVLKNLAKKISQKSRKFSSSTGAQIPGTNRKCPACQRVNPSSKKRCQFCGEYLIGRPCPTCGTLNHNRTRECFKCYSAIPLRGWTQDGYSELSTEQQAILGDLNEGEMIVQHQQQEVGVVTEVLSPPTSPKFSAPPIRSAALKSMFPQVSPKPGLSPQQQAAVPPHSPEEPVPGQVVTKTMYSGTIVSSRRCLECGQLNSRMAKKCMQCRSPLQGKACHRCGRPNLNHSTQCYKCGVQIVPTATKWVYVGSHSGRAYKATQDVSIDSKLLESRAPISCIRCHKLRLQGKFKCGRCGDVYTAKALIDPLRGEDDENSHMAPSPAKKRKENPQQKDDSTSPEPPDPKELEQFARNVLSLGLGEQLVPLLSGLEEEHRGKVHPAEEELEATDEQYQAFLLRKKSKSTEFEEVQSEMSGLLTEVDTHNSALHKLLRREKEAREIVASFPEKICQLQNKLAATVKLISHSATIY